MKKRTLYRAAAVAMLLILPLAVYPSLLTLAALGSLPALILALVGVVRPAYFVPHQLTDPSVGVADTCTRVPSSVP